MKVLSNFVYHLNLLMYRTVLILFLLSSFTAKAQVTLPAFFGVQAKAKIFDPTGWQILMRVDGKKSSSSWPSSASRTSLASPGYTDFRTATSANTGATSRTVIGNTVGVYEAFFSKKNITKIALVDGSSSNLNPASHSNFLIYDLVESTGNESIYDILLRLDTYLMNNASIAGNDAVWGSSSVINLTAGVNGYSGLLSSYGGTSFKTNDNQYPGKFVLMGINREYDNDIQALCAFSGDLNSGKGDAWRGDNPLQSFWSYWGHDFHSNSQTQRMGSSYQSVPGTATVAAWTGAVYLLAF